MKNIDDAVVLPFANSISNTKELYAMIEQLEGLQRFLYRGKKGYFTQKAPEYLSEGIAKIFKEIEERGLEPVEEDKQMDFLDALIRYLKAIPVVKTTLAFEPSSGFLSSISSAISQHVGSKVILDIVFDETIVGGAVFEFGGRYFRHAIDTQVDAYVNKFFGENFARSNQ